MKNDSQVEIRGAPGTIHRFEKLFQKWNIFAPGKQFIVKKNDPAVEIRRAPGTIQRL